MSRVLTMNLKNFSPRPRCCPNGESSTKPSPLAARRIRDAPTHLRNTPPPVILRRKAPKDLFFFAAQKRQREAAAALVILRRKAPKDLFFSQRKSGSAKLPPPLSS